MRNVLNWKKYQFYHIYFSSYGHFCTQTPQFSMNFHNNSKNINCKKNVISFFILFSTFRIFHKNRTIWDSVHIFHQQIHIYVRKKLWKIISYFSVFIGKINEIHILIIARSNQEFPGFFEISRVNIETWSLYLNPSWTTLPFQCLHTINTLCEKEVEKARTRLQQLFNIAGTRKSRLLVTKTALFGSSYR